MVFRHELIYNLTYIESLYLGGLIELETREKKLF